MIVDFKSHTIIILNENLEFTHTDQINDINLQNKTCCV